MQGETKEVIEKSVLEDINYITNYWPSTVAAKSAQHFSSMTIIKPIAVNVYPQIYADLVQRFEKNEAAIRLKRLGLRETKFLYATLPQMLKKPQNFVEIFSEVAQSHLNSKLFFTDKVKDDNKKLKSCKIIVENCFFCSEITVFEDIEIPYCIPNAGVYQNLYNIKSLMNKNMEPRLIRIDAVKSAKFDGDTCEYHLVVLD
ncbi:MAG TPA: hypothetical protein VMV49_06645 [Candidatus Deferrimicrobium sp.]|nr:hypothetical protein [Candidatus Deferrimicrobium sp.]